MKEYVAYRTADKLSPSTKSDSSWRLNAFASHFGKVELHQIAAGDIENFLKGHTEGWSRRSFYKRLLPMFAHAKRHRWIAVSPFDDLAAPETPGGRRAVYSPDQLKSLLEQSMFYDDIVLIYIALAGLGFFRSQELVRRFDSEPVLEWSDVLSDRKLIHVREGVAKSTRRKFGNERFCPIHPALQSWLNFISERRRKGRIVNVSVRSFRKRLHAVFDRAKVPLIDNGLRKSAISYWLAAYPEYGVAQVSQWAGNSESNCRQHYLKILTKEDGLKWFDSAK